MPETTPTHRRTNTVKTAASLLGRDAAKPQLERIRQTVQNMETPPHLHVIRIGNDPASVSYTLLKTRQARAIGMHSSLTELPADCSQQRLLALIQKLNDDPSTHGILVQLPLPSGSPICKQTVLAAINPDKDADGLHPTNTGKLWTKQNGLRPCTPVGILNLLEHYSIALTGAHVVIVNDSPLVGRPLTALLLERLATVTIAHKATRNLKEITRQADVLVTATGQLGLICAQFVKPGAVVIDVSINRKHNDPRLYGDCQDDVWETASAVTPVPGGVGPMTVAQLLENTLFAASQITIKAKTQHSQSAPSADSRLQQSSA